MKLLTAILFMLITASAYCGGFSVNVPTQNSGFFAMEQVYTGCGGGNVSPEVVWSGAPKGTESFALTVFDPDAPTGHGWMHWVVTDIPTDINRLAKGAGTNGKLPAGTMQTATDFGRPGYGGPCPPKGKPHRYIFTVYAVKSAKLGLNEKTSPAEAQAAISKASIGMAQTIVRYGR